MREVLAGDGSESRFPIVSVMEKIKLAQKSGYEYCIFNMNNYRPEGVMHMVPAMICSFCRFGDFIHLNVQDKTKNSYGWGGCFPSGYNNNNKLQNFCDALAISETDKFYAWVLRSMCAISGSPLESILLISVDGKLNESSFCSLLPGKNFFQHFISMHISSLTCKFLLL